ncbi:GNAT family N-acetyltransferase [Ligilactobacillus sp. LYQ60]|uniref:GNAT family N-acetyltransferase n=1 Tax=unclassified Ligilactobacillus TaxID=2767920 RepID=UPI00385212C8
MKTPVTISRVRPQDARVLYHLIKQSRAQLERWLPALRAVTTLAAAQQFVSQYVDAWRQRSGVGYVIRVNGQAVGMLTLENMSAITADVGYWLENAAWGNGYVIAALRQLFPRVQQAGLTSLQLITAADNLRSQRVAQHTGFYLRQQLVGGTHGEVRMLLYERRLD